MLSEYKGKKIRKAGNIIHCNFNDMPSFNKYGLNKYKNLLHKGTIHFDSEEEMNRYAIVVLQDISKDFTSVALFFDYKDNTNRKIVYELFFDFVDGEPEAFINKIGLIDPKGDSFAQLDYESNYEMYGLLVHKRNGTWEIVDR